MRKLISFFLTFTLLLYPTLGNAIPTLLQFAALLVKKNTVLPSSLSGPSNVPSDGLAIGYIYVTPRINGVKVGAGKTVEVTKSSASVTFGGTGGACRTPSASCAKLTDAGNGTYTFNVKSSTVAASSFTIVVADTSDVTLSPVMNITFDSSVFTTISSNTTITSATHGGKNLYFTGGTGTFDNTTMGATFGDIFVRGGTLKHTATTTAAVYTLDIKPTSLTLQSGSINANNLGYTAGYSYGSSAPNTNLASKLSSSGFGTSCSNTYYYDYYTGGSHGGKGAFSSSAASGATYDDYRNPALPGGGGSKTGVGGGVVRIKTAGACTVLSGATISADGIGGTNSNPAGGSIYLSCGYFGGNAAAAAVTAKGGAASLFTSSPCAGYTSYYYTAGGGGGRIAFDTTNDVSAFTGSFAYPSGSSALANFVSVVTAAGGARNGTNVSMDGGGAGTVFLKHSGLTNGDLIIDNAGQTLSGSYAGSTPFVSSTANSNTVYANSGANTLQITAAGTPFNNMVNLFAGLTIHAFQTSASADPYSGSHISAVVASNTNNTLVASSSPFPTISNDYYYRFVYLVDHLDVGGNAQVNTSGADIMIAAPASDACDLHSATAGKFDVPGTATITGNSLGAVTCLDAQVTTKGSSVNFANYFLH